MNEISFCLFFCNFSFAGGWQNKERAASRPVFGDASRSRKSRLSPKFFCRIFDRKPFVGHSRLERRSFRSRVFTNGRRTRDYVSGEDQTLNTRISLFLFKQTLDFSGFILADENIIIG